MNKGKTLTSIGSVVTAFNSTVGSFAKCDCDNSNTYIISNEPVARKLDTLFSEDVRSILRNNPINQQEISSTINGIRSRADIIGRIIPNDSSCYHDAVFNAVGMVLSDNELFISTANDLNVNGDVRRDSNEIEYEKLGDSLLDESKCREAEDEHSRIASDWSKLCSDRFCTICQDLLASPHVLNCGHSYCWICIKSHMKKCVSEDEDIDVIHICPTCKVEVESMTFERTFAQEITRLVTTFPNCKEKQEWLHRNTSFVDDEKKKTRKTMERLPGFDDNIIFWEVVLAVAASVILLILKVKRFI